MLERFYNQNPILALAKKHFPGLKPKELASDPYNLYLQGKGGRYPISLSAGCFNLGIITLLPESSFERDVKGLRMPLRVRVHERGFYQAAQNFVTEYNKTLGLEAEVFPQFVVPKP